MILPRDFYARPTLDVARDLLGRRLVRIIDGLRLSGRIVETEAYIGETDQASHAAHGWRERNAVLYGPPGRAYVYRIYGIHYSLNTVAERDGFPAGVLIRGLAPEEGIEVMREWRAGRPDRELTNGPGKLAQALGIDLRLNGTDLTQAGPLFIETGRPVADACVRRTPRIGVVGDETARTVPWRFVADLSLEKPA